MQNFIVDIANYNHHCNEKLIDAFRHSGSQLSDKSQLLFSHILNAHHIWNSRILKEEPLLMPWDSLKLGKFDEVNEQNSKRTLEIISTVDLSTPISYRNTKGEEFTNTVMDILFHVFNHSNYHRGQIAMDMKSSGLDPIVSDYIFYKREMITI
jgi:uncharacterized damage-inducible protein DinB